MPPGLSFGSFGTVINERKDILMGLDMYAFTTAEAVEADVDFTPKTATELAYWRKHPNLHGWMERLYRAKGGEAECFNCVNVALTAEDIDRLEADIRADALPFTEGFFFGESDGSEVEEDLAFITNARAALADGKTVFYSSWW